MQTESVNNSVTVRQEVTGYSMRFDDIVTSPNYYRFEIEALQVATENTPITITVNTDGGSLATGIEMVNEILSCKAKVTGVLRSSCHSCGSIIFLACDDHEVGISSEMLLHSGSGGSGGTPAQTVQRAESYKRQVRSLFETVYKGFLSQEEIDLMIEHDKEYIFCSEEIAQRLESMYQYRSNQQSSAMQEMFNLQNEQSDKYESLLLDKLVEKGVISKEDAAIAKKVQQASVELDEAEGETLFAQLNASEEEQCCGEYSSEENFLEITDINGDIWKAEVIATDEGYTLGDIYQPETDEDFVCNSLYLSDAYDIEGLRGIADIFDIEYKKNIGKERLAAKIVNYFESELEEFLES